MLLFIIIVALLLILFYKMSNPPEHFNLLETGTQTNDCHSKTLGSCLNYANCGIATVGGEKMCTFGDEEGPYYDMPTNFDQWTYKNHYDKHIFNETDGAENNNIWSTFYPIYDIFYPSPTSRSALF